jgi:tetratricopeptide (TPR) repeat protein
MRSAAALLAGLLAGMPVGARAQDPECVRRCRELASKKELREGMTEEVCALHLCHDEGRRLYREGQYDKAFAALDRIEPRVADSPAYQLDRGLVEYALGHFEQALAAFDRVAQREPDSLRAGAQRAHALVRLERFSEARAQLDKLLALPAAKTELQGLKTASYVHGNLGALSLIQDDVAGARKALDQALAVDPRNGMAATYLHRVLPEVEAKRLDGRSVWLMMLASEDAALQVFPRARSELDQLLQRSPKFAEGWFLQADILRAQRDYATCEQSLLQGEQHLPDDAGLKAERLRCQLLRQAAASQQTGPALDELLRLGREHPENERIRSILRALSSRPG